MALVFTEEQEQLRSVVRDLLSDRSPEEQVRRLMETDAGFDEGVWRTMADIGLLGLAVEEEYGGAGGGFGEICAVMEEMGRALLPAPYLSSVVLATTALQLSGDADAKARWLPDLVSGDLRATLAFVDDDGDWDLERTTTVAEQVGDQWRVRGVKNYVLDGHTADLVFVLADTPEGLSLFAVDSASAELTSRRLTTLDQTRRLARVELDAAPATLIGRPGDARDHLCAVRDLALVALSAENVGGAQRVLDMSVEYAKLREQFGRPIGSFQAIKHKCADMLTQLELARSLMLSGQDVAVAKPDDLPKAAAMAKALSGDAYFTCTTENIQIHGGIGFTWEHPAHLYFRRAKSNQLLFGDATGHRARLAAMLDAEQGA
ncbi:acyl-CoA dehydrogenase family protein [Pseudonocardia sp. N23]|uniref:acyl-CoA dehydrogenase family protein n=1 Tax=Pseudonocardia sp. N23 TaxID=1987376 RepID=UPI000BFE1CF0|nr:acyl-CoA dehydrogenase [Pseudonocardia sp. N23]GAY10873.1 butyryl-CoA dehydrogenase [Pseudonocardia sp. N23]